jgi:hypothetical protein
VGLAGTGETLFLMGFATTGDTLFLMGFAGTTGDTLFLMGLAGTTGDTLFLVGLAGTTGDTLFLVGLAGTGDTLLGDNFINSLHIDSAFKRCAFEIPFAFSNDTSCTYSLKTSIYYLYIFSCISMKAKKVDMYN